jgi:hypothetical protein
MMNRIAQLLVLALVVITAGCASDEPLRSTLDDKGLTWVSMDRTVTLARPVPRFSAAARDYIYIAPVEANDMGTRSHYLWIGLGTTVDRAWGRAAPNAAVTLVLLLDGKPVALPLSSWDADLNAALYDTPAPVYQVQRARVTLDQLERIATAQSIDVQVVADDGSVAGYELWDGAWSDWHAFLTAVETSSELDVLTGRASSD